MNPKSTLSEMQQEIHATARAHGWWDTDRGVPECLMLMVSELAEALEEYRQDNPNYYTKPGGKPEGLGVELADCIIRILDFAESQGMNMSEFIQIKHEYNQGRPYRHGNKKA